MFKVHEYTSLRVAADFLNGCVIGGPTVLNGLSLSGKTITFNKPNFAHTFTDGTGPDDGRLYPADIKGQLETASAGNLLVTFDGGRIILRETLPTTGVELDATPEAAKTLLGLAPGSIGKRVYSSSSASYPRLEAIQATSASVVLLVWEE